MQQSVIIPLYNSVLLLLKQVSRDQAIVCQGLPRYLNDILWIMTKFRLVRILGLIEKFKVFRKCSCRLQLVNEKKIYTYVYIYISWHSLMHLSIVFFLFTNRILVVLYIVITFFENRYYRSIDRNRLENCTHAIRNRCIRLSIPLL